MFKRKAYSKYNKKINKYRTSERGLSYMAARRLSGKGKKKPTPATYVTPEKFKKKKDDEDMEDIGTPSTRYTKSLRGKSTFRRSAFVPLIKPSTEAKLVSDALKSMRYPHYRNLGPKIPDGLSQSSIGRSYNTTYTHSMYTALCCVTLIPGLSSTMYVEDIDTAGLVLSQQLIYTPQHGVYTDYKDTALPSTAQRRAMMNDVDKWRIVSQGMSIACLNTHGDNQGVWESVRRSLNIGGTIINSIDAGATTTPIRQPVTDGVTCYEDTKYGSAPATPFRYGNKFSDAPSYETGDLKNIHKKYWQLNNTTTNHNFIDMDDTVWLTVDPTYPNSEQFDVEGSRENQRFADQNFDNNHDVISVFIRGVPNETQFRVDVVQNQEFQVLDSCMLKPFETPGLKRHPGLAAFDANFRRRLLKNN